MWVVFVCLDFWGKLCQTTWGVPSASTPKLIMMSSPHETMSDTVNHPKLTLNYNASVEMFFLHAIATDVCAHRNLRWHPEQVSVFPGYSTQQQPNILCNETQRTRNFRVLIASESCDIVQAACRIREYALCISFFRTWIVSKAQPSRVL